MSSNVVFAYGNVLTPLIPIVATDEDPDAPAALSLADFRSVMGSTTSCALINVTLTVGSGAVFNCAALHGDNLTEDGTVEVQGSDDNFSTHEVIVPARPKGSTILFERFDDKSFAKVRFVFEDPTNPEGIIRLGKMFLGTAWQSDANYNWGGVVRGMMDLSRGMPSLNAVQHFNAKPKPRYQRLEFSRVSPAEELQMIAMRDEVGITDPFIVAIDPENDSSLVFLARFTQLPDPAYVDFQQYDYGIQLLEVV